MKYQNSDSITVTVIGDGGIEEGICWEALNMASVMSLPIVFIIENNGYSVHTDINKRTKLNNLHERVATFGVPSIKVSCLDFEGLDSALNKAVTEARVNRNPSCIEVDVWRYAPHVGPENDDQEYHYRNKELVKFWSKNDPLLKLRELILASGLKKEVDSIESRNKKLIDDAIKLAKDGTFPKLSNVIKHNLSQSYSTKINEIRLVTTSGDYLKNQPDTIVTPY